MANLIGMPRDAWKRQPSDVFRADIEKYPSLLWLSGGNLLFDGPFGIFINAVNGQKALNYDSNFYFKRKSSRFGTGVVIEGSHSNARYIITPSLLNGATEFTLLSCFEFNSAAESVQWLNFRVNYAHSLDIFSKTSSSLTFGTDWAGAWNGTSTKTITGLNSGQLVCIAASVSSNNGARLFHNGIFSGTKNGSSFTLSYADSVKVVAQLPSDTPYLMGAVFRRALNDGELIDLTANPWQLFKPRTARFISIPSAAVFKPYWARSRSLIIGSGV